MSTARTTTPDWVPQGIALLLIAMIGTLPFWVTDLDIQVAALFHHPQADDPWPGAQEPLWSFLYLASPMLAGFIMLGGLFIVAAGRLWQPFRRLRCYAILLIAATLLGPALIVNGVFKDNWGRPRPHEIQQLGGTRDFIPPLAIAEHGQGKSFPCGHSSVGFMLGVFFMIWRRRRPRLAWIALAISVVLGTLLGIGRMVAGDHFLSDVIWSAVVAYGVAWILYYFVLRIPRREAIDAAAAPAPLARLRRPKLTMAAYAVAAVLLAGSVLIATPLKTVQILMVRPGDFEPAPRVLRLVADHADVIIFAAGTGDLRAKVRLEARGFGLPWSRVEQTLTSDEQVLTYRVTHDGLFTEKDTLVALGVVAGEWERVEIQLAIGNIRVYEATGDLPPFRLQTDDGKVIQDPSSS